MATTHDLSKIIDSNGDEYLIKAKSLESQVTVTLTGNVTGSMTTDFGQAASMSTTIANNAVTTAKIADGNVTTGKIADGNVTLDKIADSAKSGAVSDNDGKLATHAQVKSAIDAAISGQGAYLGKQTVATINTWTAANLHNGDRVIASDSGTVTLGNIAVRAGEDLIFWKTGSGYSQVAVWQSMDGEFKLKQTAKSDPTASGTTLTAIATLTQDANGEITATKKTIQDGTTSQKGVVQLQNSVDSTTTTKAVTPQAVNTAIANEATARNTAITTAINALDATKTSTDGTNVQVKVTEVDGKITAVNITTDNTASAASLAAETAAREAADNALSGRIAAIEGANVTGVKGEAETEYRTGNVDITKANVGLGNVGNFKAVSTVANQSLSTTERSNARTNIGLGNVDDKSVETIKSEFTGSIASGNDKFVKGGDVYTALAGKEGSFAINYKAADNALVFHKAFGTES